MTTPTDIDQAELALRTSPALAGRVTRDSVAELCGLLRGRGWVTAREIQRWRPHWRDRFIRLLANESAGRIVSFPGSPGYRLAEDLPAHDIATLDHAAAALIHQGRDMVRRGIKFRRLAALRRAAAELLQP
jgi:hypothetical protein